MTGPGEVENRESLDKRPGQPTESHTTDDSQKPSRQELRAALDRVLSSQALRPSESLRTLLAFVGERSLNNEAEALKEYAIGIEAFNKPRDYDPQVDPAVRVIASKLRHKLEEYYLKEGTNDLVRIEMPRGHFALKFTPVTQEAPPQHEELQRSEIARWKILAWCFAVVAGLALTATLYLWVQVSKVSRGSVDARPWTPELQAIWEPFLTGDRPVVISLGTPRFTKYKYGFFRNPRVNSDEEASRSDELRAIQKLVGSPFAVPAFPYSGAGEAMGAFRLGRFLHGRVANLTLRRSSTLHWDTIWTSNVIFLGAPKSNPQLYDLPLEDGFVVHDGAIRNPKPRTGEAEAYRSTWAPNEVDLVEDYALVSRLHNLHGAGDILALGAGSTEATWAAVEYVTQPEYARELVSRVGMSAGSLPDEYQVIIRVRFRQQVPVEISYVTHRVLPTQSKAPADTTSNPTK